MADSPTLPATGTGTADIRPATDDIGGIHYQRIKLSDGTADSATPINSGVGGPANGLRVVDAAAATPTQSSVAASATSVTVLAANANRMGASIYNDSTVNLYLKMGATASLSSFSVKMVPGALFEVPFSYTGILDGIWDSATGNARVTELT